MKKLIMALTTIMMLTGCATGNNAKEISEIVSTDVTSTEAVPETTVTATAQVTEEPTVTTVLSEEYTELPTISEDDIPSEERKALDKLNNKYGRKFTPLRREYPEWGVMGRSESEPKNLWYYLEDSDGDQFRARITENTDTVLSDCYLSLRYRDRYCEEVAELCKRLMPDGKVWITGADHSQLPFDTPADISYEEFCRALDDNGGLVSAVIYITEDMEVPDDVREYFGKGKKCEYGYVCQISVFIISQEDYDRLDDIITEFTVINDYKVVNKGVREYG